MKKEKTHLNSQSLIESIRKRFPKTFFKAVKNVMKANSTAIPAKEFALKEGIQ